MVVSKFFRYVEKKVQEFFSKVKIINQCWEWQGHIDKKGYGRISIKSKSKLAHRFSYEHHKGEIPKDLVLDHLCRNTKCVNPNHLEAVTIAENVLRGDHANKGLATKAFQQAKTHCKHGHPFEGENLRLAKLHTGGIGRICKTCAKEKRLAHQRTPAFKEKRRQKYLREKEQRHAFIF